MSEFYRVRIEFQSPFGTKLRSGTLFGHLCWAWRQLFGEDSLCDWLAQLENAPFLISDGFPAGFLPRPLLAPRAGVRSGKDAKKKVWIRQEDFLSLRARCHLLALEPLLVSREIEPSEEMIAHNTIDRRRGTTLAEGGLYFMEEYWPKPESAKYDVWVSTSVEENKLEELFRHTGQWGYGRDASTGRGIFRAQVEPAPQSMFSGGGNRRMSLSHGSLTPNMLEPRYRLYTNYGRLGSTYATSGQPFKRPVTLLRPGATFHAVEPGPFGELISNVHAGRPEIRENAWHLCIPYEEV